MMMKSTDFSKAIGVSVTTLANWDIDGTLKPIAKTPKGHRLYSQEQIDAYKAQDYDNPILKGGTK